MRTLSVTISDELYDRLKQTVSPRAISKFVSAVLTESLSKEREMLYQAYLDASKDADREADLNDWDIVNIESWEKNSPS
jgi:hypothetical protein